MVIASLMLLTTAKLIGAKVSGRQAVGMTFYDIIFVYHAHLISKLKAADIYLGGPEKLIFF